MSIQLSQFRGFDFHCHVDLHTNPADFIAAREQGQILTLAVTTTPKAWPQNREWASRSTYVHAAVGLHPELIGERHAEVALLEEYIGESRLVGEIGLDGSPQHRATWRTQQAVFARALKRAQSLGGRVLSIHSRRAADEVITSLGEHTTADRVLPILHWFSGSRSAAMKAVAQGCYFSINPGMLDHKAGLALVRGLPLERLLTETDAPFSFQGSQSSPSDIVANTQRLGAALAVEYSELHDTLSRNAVRVLRYAGRLNPTD